MEKTDFYYGTELKNGKLGKELVKQVNDEDIRSSGMTKLEYLEKRILINEASLTMLGEVLILHFPTIASQLAPIGDKWVQAIRDLEAEQYTDSKS